MLIVLYSFPFLCYYYVALQLVTIPCYNPF